MTGRRAIARAFTLIEVLIAVLVLALGVLGLAAVFSVGIPQQRIAGEQLMGLNTLQSARAVLLNDKRLNDPRSPIDPAQMQDRGWYGLQQKVADDPGQVLDPDETWSPVGEWILPADVPGEDEKMIYLDPVADGSDGDAGEIVIESATGLPQLAARIPVSERLVPAPYTPGAEPQYVWDFVARRVPSGALDPATGLRAPTRKDPIEIAVFVRRVDPGIQVPLRDRSDADDRVRFGRRLRLSDLLTMNAEQITGDLGGQIPEALRVVPVSADPATSEPRRDGRTLSSSGQVGQYATPIGVGVADTGKEYPRLNQGPGGGGRQNEIIPRNRIPLAPGGAAPEDLNRLRLASQVGQTLIDRFGNVYRIVGVDDELSEETGARVVIVDPPVPPSLDTPLGFRYPNRSDLDGQVFITTPQTPVAVDVFRVTP